MGNIVNKSTENIINEVIKLNNEWEKLVLVEKRQTKKLERELNKNKAKLANIEYHIRKMVSDMDNENKLLILTSKEFIEMLLNIIEIKRM